MKIGMVRRGYSGAGGAEIYLRRFAEAAGAAGHECVLFTGFDWPAAAWSGPLVRVRGNSPRAFADNVEKARLLEPCDCLFSFERIWRCDVYRAGDGVHAAWLERRARFESRWRTMARRFHPNHRALLELEASLFDKAGTGARAVIANSRMVKREIEAHFHYPGTRIHVVYNGVPPFHPTPTARDDLRRKLDLAERDFVLLFAGSGWERKGLRFAIEALNLVDASNPILLVAGNGKRSGLPRSAGVRFLGPRGDIPQLLSAVDAFLLPTFYEPFSNACLEALAAGRPVITTRHNGFAEVIEDGVHGEIVEDPRDVKSIAQAIERWTSPEKREAAEPHLRALGARYSLDENVRQTCEVLFAVGSAGVAG